MYPICFLTFCFCLTWSIFLSFQLLLLNLMGLEPTYFPFSSLIARVKSWGSLKLTKPYLENKFSKFHSAISPNHKKNILTLSTYCFACPWRLWLFGNSGSVKKFGLKPKYNIQSFKNSWNWNVKTYGWILRVCISGHL